MREHLRVGDICVLRGGEVLRYAGPYESGPNLKFTSISGSRVVSVGPEDVLRVLCAERDSAMLEIRIIEATSRGLDDCAQEARLALRELLRRNEATDVEVRNAQIRMRK